MTYLALCTFDLKGATGTDYSNAYADLEKIGLKKVHTGTNREVVIPTTTALGYFNGESSSKVRDTICERVRVAFKNRGFKSEIFVVVGDNGTWGSTTT